MNATGWNIVSWPEKWRLILLDNVNGERVLINMFAAPDKFDLATQKTQEILDGVSLAP
jgi:hypothetical protein